MIGQSTQAISGGWVEVHALGQTAIALRLEFRTGLRHSRGSVLAYAKRRWGIPNAAPGRARLAKLDAADALVRMAEKLSLELKEKGV